MKAKPVKKKSKTLKLLIVQSEMFPHLVSLRTREGRSVHELLTDAGFEKGDKVILTLEKESK